jgi:quercetin dioxygenase-like cupin family protein
MKHMKLVRSFAMVVFTLFCHQLMAQDASTIFTKDGVKLHVNNTGNNTLVELNKEDSLFAFNIAVASFPAGKRLAWHAHPGGQVLVITDGVGYYQERGKSKLTVRKGEVIKCLPGVEHWHGASAETGVTYMATYSTKKGATVWLLPVTDEEYAK